MSENRVKIRLSSYNPVILYDSVESIISAIKRTGATLKGPIPLPTKIRKYTINRSPQVNKKSRDQLEIRLYKLLIIMKPSPQTIESLRKLELEPGIGVEIKYESS